MKDREIKQRMIFMCNLPIGKGSEFNGLHPCVIASVDIRNGYSPNVYVFPITSSDKKWQPTHWKLKKDKYKFFNHETNTVICEEGRSISRSRLQKLIGEIDKNDFKEILKCKEFIFYSIIDGVPLNMIKVGKTFGFNNEIYLKTKKYNVEKYYSMKLDTCEIFEFDKNLMVIPCWNIKDELKYKNDKILEYLNNKKIN